MLLSASNTPPQYLLCFATELTPRFRYTVHLVFEQLLAVPIIFTDDAVFFQKSTLPKFCYADENNSNCLFFIKNSHLLFENFINPSLDVEGFKHLDVLAKIFCLVSRYEEYIASPDLRDTHRRYTAQNSWSKKLNILHQPIVNQWVIEIGEKLIRAYPDHYKAPPQYLSHFSFMPTYDIDQAWAFLHKGWKRNLGGFFKDFFAGNWSAAFRRLWVLLGIKNDPEHTFDYIATLQKRYNLKPYIFWLLGDYGAFDKNINWSNKKFRNLIRAVAKNNHIGIHPSYASNENKDLVKNEIIRLSDLTKERVTHSRQHFLKLKLPETYRTLLENSIEADFSMGYADDIGFRAGIATPYFWFDLGKNEATALKIYPFAVMDVTLKEYLKLSPETALETVRQIVESTKNVGGIFCTLWHNSTLSNTGEWYGWRDVYEKTIVMAQNTEGVRRER